MSENGYVYGVQMGWPTPRVMGPLSSRRVAEQFCGGDLSRLRRRPVYAIPPWETVPSDSESTDPTIGDSDA